jgi:phosphoribosylformylglycinamidine cyclo-ligase
MATHGQYQQAGVDYEVLDRIKRAAIARAGATAPLLAAAGGREVAASRGASAYVFEVGDLTLAMVIEGLGTKSLIAEEYLQLTGISRYADIAIDAVGTIVNDVVSVGALPLVVTAYFATGDAGWYADERRSLELLAGWQKGCEESGAAWGGGESPALPGLVTGAGIELAGSALGLVPPGREPVLGDTVAPGDAIVLLSSSGLHANGASLARRIARDNTGGLLAPLPSGRTFGEALLDPSVLYPRFVRNLLATDVRPKFLNGVTGHGLMKVMRPAVHVRYVIEQLPKVPEVLAYMVAEAGLSPTEAYGTLNMGIGFVAVVPAGDVATTLEVAKAAGYGALEAGRVTAGPRSVVVPALNVSFGDNDLQLR